MPPTNTNIMVAVRLRPMNREEEKRNDVDIVRVFDSKLVVVLDPAETSAHHIPGLMTRSRERRYAFDHAFDNGVPTRTVYENTTRFLIDGVVGGFNATVFAYGCTGAGKTYTMLGTSEVPGLMALTLKDLFSRIEEVGEKEDAEFKVTLSYLEIYNESIRDLLTPSNEFLDLREDPIKGPTVAGISEVECAGARNVMKLLRRGDRRRTTEGTQANEASSRSHAVLQIVVEQKEKQPGTVANISVGKLSLIDLAGSERAAATQNRGIRLVEGANINRSLLALGNCINALCATSSGKGTFVPYRDSKLTRLLKDSLGGNCRTVMIANIGPSGRNVEETLNTLKYANRAKNIKTKVERNVLNVSYHMTEYVTLISGLRSEISTLKRKLSASNVHASLREHAEKSEISVLRNKVVGLFKERMQLRRSLIELEAQNLQNVIEAQRIESELGHIEHDGRTASHTCGSGAANADTLLGATSVQVGAGTARAPAGATAGAGPPLPPPPPRVAALRGEREQLRRATINNEGLKGELEKRFRDNQRQANALRTQMQTRITGSERRELMELEYRVGMLELENMEVERYKMLHRSSIAHRDTVIQKLLEQLHLRDLVIEEQHAALRNAGVDKDIRDLDQFNAMEPLAVLRALPSRNPPATPAMPVAKAFSWGDSSGTSGGSGAPRRRELVGANSERGGRRRLPHHSNDSDSKRRPGGAPPDPVADFRSDKHALRGAKRQERPRDRERRRRQRDSGHAVRKQHPYLRYLKQANRSHLSSHASVPEDSGEGRGAHDGHRGDAPGGDESYSADQKYRGRRRRSGNRKRTSKNKKSRWRAKIKTYLSPALGRHCTFSPAAETAHQNDPRYGRGTTGVDNRAIKGSRSTETATAQLPPIDCVYVLPEEGGLEGFVIREAPTHEGAVTLASPTSRNPQRELASESSPNGYLPVTSSAGTMRNFTATRPAEAAAKTSPRGPVSSGAGSVGNAAVSPKAVHSYHRLAGHKPPSLQQFGALAGRRRAGRRVKVKMIAPRDVPSPKAVGVHKGRGFGKPSQERPTAVPAKSTPAVIDRNRHRSRRHDRIKNRESGSRDPGVRQGKDEHCVSMFDTQPQTDCIDPRQPKHFRAQPMAQAADPPKSRVDPEEKRAEPDFIAGAPFLEAKHGAEEKPRCERHNQMRRVWGELEFILRQQICSNADVDAAQRAAHKSLAFLDQIDALSTKTKLLRGQLSRWLMPYSENTSAFDQRALTPSSWASSPLLEGGHLDEENYRQLIAGANTLRSLVRIKIADDEDLNTARRAVKDAAWFFSQLNEDTPYRDIMQICQS